MCPSYSLHVATPTFRADADIGFPHSFEQLSDRQTCISGFEPLMSLQCEDQFQVFTFPTVVQESIVADPLKTVGKDMHQIASHEFFMGQSDDPAGVSWLFTSCGKGDLILRNGTDAAVGNGDLMGVSSKIFNGISKPIESLFDIRTPVFCVKFIPEFRPGVRITEVFTGRRKMDLPFFIKGIQFMQIFSFKFIPEDSDRNKKFICSFPDLMIRGQSPAGYDAVHMYMVIQLLIPGVKDLDDPGCCTEPFFIFREFYKCLCTASVQKGIEKLLVTVDQGVEFMRKSKYHMKVRGVDHLSTAFVYPDLLVDGLAVGAVAVSTGVIVEFQMAAVRAL